MGLERNSSGAFWSTLSRASGLLASESGNERLLRMVKNMEALRKCSKRFSMSAVSSYSMRANFRSAEVGRFRIFATTSFCTSNIVDLAEPDAPRAKAMW